MDGNGGTKMGFFSWISGWVGVERLLPLVIFSDFEVRDPGDPGTRLNQSVEPLAKLWLFGSGSNLEGWRIQSWSVNLQFPNVSYTFCITLPVAIPKWCNRQTGSSTASILHWTIESWTIHWVVRTRRTPLLSQNLWDNIPATSKLCQRQ